MSSGGISVTDELCDRIMALSEEAFAHALYKTAYHLLNAALHCTASVEDREKLLAVQRLAEEQLAWIDAHVPDTMLSTHMAIKTHSANLYDVLIREAQVHLDRLQAHQRLHEHNDRER